MALCAKYPKNDYEYNACSVQSTLRQKRKKKEKEMFGVKMINKNIKNVY